MGFLSFYQVGMLKGHHLPINQLCFAPSGHQLLTASGDCKVKVWSGHLGKMVASLSEDGTGGVTSSAFSLDGSRLACGCHEGQVLLYDVVSGNSNFFLTA
jgi:WD40 repeat protein